MSEETKKAPAIRFQGFTDDWEQRKLGEVFFQTSKYVNPKESNLELWSLTVENGLTPKTERYNREFLVKKEDQFKSVDHNEFIYNPMNMTLGAVDLNLTGKTVAVSGYYITMLSKDGFDSKYFSIWLKSPLAIKMYKLYATGSLIERQRVQFPTLSQIKSSVPQIEEQTKIGSFFKQLDDTIALHLCKQRQLGLLKQRLIKEILPQSDSTLPHLRFANFRKPWEQHQLKEVLKVNSGRDYKHLNEGNIPVYGTGGYMLSVDGKLSDVDGIGLGRKGTIDKPQYLKAPFWTVDTLFYLTPSPNYDIYFLYTLIQNVNWKSMDESTGVPSLSKSVIERVTLTFPILEEQQKIGSFFREFDNTISLHQQKIAHLKALKSTILNKMFI